MKEKISKQVEEVTEVESNILPEMNIEEAIKELRKEDKRKFVQSVDVIVNLQKFDSRKEALNSFVQVPHGYDKKIAAFLTKKVNGIDVILKDSFDNYKNLRDTKRIAKEYDMFISFAGLMGQVATKFGRALGPSGKMPSPQLGIVVKEDEDTISALSEKMKKSIKIKTKEKSIKVCVGKEDMKDSEIKDNILATVNGIIDLLPQKKDNVKNVLIKFTMTKPIKVKI